MASFAVSIVGADRPGIIASVTEAAAALGANIEDSSMTLLRGHFAWILVLSAEVTREALAGRIDELLGADLVATVLPLRPATSAPQQVRRMLTLHGADSPGLVAAATGAVAAGGGNVVNLTTRLSGSLFVAVAEVELATEVEADGLEATLAELGSKLGVDLRWQPLETDEL